MFGKLTETNGTFDLPVHSIHTRPKGVKDYLGNSYPRTIWRIWPDNE